MKLSLVALLAVASCAGCPPPSPAPPAPDAGTAPILEAGPDASVYERACAQLAALGCQEGSVATCASVMQHAQESRLTDMHPACLASASSKDGARACGSVKCP